MNHKELSDEKVLAMAAAVIAEEEDYPIERIRVVSFRKVQKTALEQYVEDHAIAYKKFVLPALATKNEFVGRTMMNKYRIRINNQVYEMEVELLKEGEQSVMAAGAKKSASRQKSLAVQEQDTQVPADGAVSSPMPGKVLGVKVKEGDMVLAGQTVMVLEAMKLENNIEAPKAGRIVQLQVVEGEIVASGDCLFVIE